MSREDLRYDYERERTEKVTRNHFVARGGSVPSSPPLSSPTQQWAKLI